MKRFFASVICTALTAMLIAPVQGQRSVEQGPKFVPGEMLVQLKAGTTESDIERVAGRAGGSGFEKVRGAEQDIYRRGDLVLVKFSPMRSVAAMKSEFEADPMVEFAEPNWIYSHQAVSNDTYYTNGSLWGMYGNATSPANQFGSEAGEAWAAGKTDCSSVWIGIIDEGYMYSHEDLAANAATNPGEIAGNGVDDDGNGYIDDVYGWDFAGGNNSVFDGSGDDHGTHVAGTIGGVGGNGKGVAGVCWSVKDDER
ncbi:MAG: S8 family serine peptidase [Pyrinomonadaceae bacterium]|nr:S8 family serine peptidase [Pyrinomonadaceae bacterium]